MIDDSLKIQVDVKIYYLDKYLPKIKGMLVILPLFEQEEQLIDIQ